MTLRDSRLTRHLGCPTDWVHLKREQRPDPAILPKKQPPATGRLVKYLSVAAVMSAGVPCAAGQDSWPGRDEPPSRFGVQQRRGVGHRTDPGTGRVPKLFSGKKACFSTACGDIPRPHGELFA
jgi:hypothetical protein